MSNKLKDLECKVCNNLVENVAADIKAVTCSDCVANIVPAPEQPKVIQHLSLDEKKERKAARAVKKAAKLESLKTAKKGKGKGWHLKKLFDWEGTFYSFGKPVTDAEVAAIRKSLTAKV